MKVCFSAERSQLNYALKQNHSRHTFNQIHVPQHMTGVQAPLPRFQASAPTKRHPLASCLRLGRTCAIKPVPVDPVFKGIPQGEFKSVKKLLRARVLLLYQEFRFDKTFLSHA
eukprot:164852-Rhodomonas_salina.1